MGAIWRSPREQRKMSVYAVTCHSIYIHLALLFCPADCNPICGAKPFFAYAMHLRLCFGSLLERSFRHAQNVCTHEPAGKESPKAIWKAIYIFYLPSHRNDGCHFFICFLFFFSLFVPHSYFRQREIRLALVPLDESSGHQFFSAVTPAPSIIHHSARSRQLRQKWYRAPAIICRSQFSTNGRKSSGSDEGKACERWIRSFRQRDFPKVFYNLILIFSCLCVASISLDIFFRSVRATLIALSWTLSVWRPNRIQLKRDGTSRRGLENENRFRKSCVKDI